MEKNDIQAGGQDPVPKQLFGSLSYSTGHLVQPLTAKLQQTQSQFRNMEGREDESLGQREQAVGLTYCAHLTFNCERAR